MHSLWRNEALQLVHADSTGPVLPLGWTHDVRLRFGGVAIGAFTSGRRDFYKGSSQEYLRE